MRNYLNLTLLVALLIFALATSALAHPAREVILTYRADAKSIVVEVNHDVRNGKSHYIDEMELTVNGEKIEEWEFSEQKNEKQETFTLLFKDPRNRPEEANEEGKTDKRSLNVYRTLFSNDIIEVEVDCNIFGTKSSKMILEDAQKNQTQRTPGEALDDAMNLEYPKDYDFEKGQEKETWLSDPEKVLTE